MRIAWPSHFSLIASVQSISKRVDRKTANNTESPSRKRELSGVCKSAVKHNRYSICEDLELKVSVATVACISYALPVFEFGDQHIGLKNVACLRRLVTCCS